MIDQQTLPTLQSAVDALFERVTAGRGDRASGTAIVSGLTGRIESLSEDQTAILGDAMGSTYGDRLLEIWSRDELHAAGASEDDFTLEKEIAYQSIRRGLDSDALKLTVETIMRAGPYRSKWDEPRGKGTWLAQDVANAIETVKKRLKKYQDQYPDFVLTGPTLEGECFSPSDDEPIPATDETCPQTVARLQRELAQARTLIATQQTIIRNHNQIEGDLRAEIERLNRRIYADYRLAKVKTLTSSQKDTIRALARVATNRAEHFDNDKPIITGKTLGEEIGKHESTGRAAADAVCNLPGAPIKRVSEYRTDGKYGQLTTYELAVRDPAEILEQFVVIAENLAEKQSSRPQPPCCKKHPSAGIVTYRQVCCKACGAVVESDLPNDQPLCVENARIAPDPPAPVIEPVSIPAQVARIAGHPGADPDARAAAMVNTQLKRDSTDKWKRYSPLAPEPVSIGQIRMTRDQEQPPGVDPPRCVTAGCQRPPANGFICAEHIRASTFAPSSEWQEIPDGYVCPPGGEFRMDFETRKNWGRWRVAQVAGGEE